MGKSIIQFNADGTADFTRKPEILEIMPAGRLSIRRMTEIVFHESVQRFTIMFLRGPLKGRHIHTSIFNEPNLPSDLSELRRQAREGQTVSCETYEEAVAVEISVVDALRRAGYKLHA
jgi:hypothetical protein